LLDNAGVGTNPGTERSHPQTQSISWGRIGTPFDQP
jgi:hypothetical protein